MRALPRAGPGCAGLDALRAPSAQARDGTLSYQSGGSGVVFPTLLTPGRRELLGDRAGRGVSALQPLSQPVVRASPLEGEKSLF